MRVVRQTLVGSLALAMLLVVGCQSNNKGKIVGKWECVNAPSLPADADKLGIKAVMEFTPDQKVSMAVVVPGGPKQVLVTATYSLGFGDTVNWNNISPPIDGKTSSRETIVITRDELKLKDEKTGWVLFKRMKEGDSPGAPK